MFTLPMLKLPAWYPGQIGIQGADSDAGLRMAPDAVAIYVDSNHPKANNSNDGTDPTNPKATLDGAAASALLTPGSIIIVGAGHAETITSATGCNLAIAGVTVEGQGEGSSRPTFTFTTANAATMTVDAAGVTIRNVVFVNGWDGQTAMLDINADDCTVDSCEFRNAAATQAVTLIDLTTAANGADRAKIINSVFVSLTIGATQAIELGAVNDAVLIANNYIWGDWSAAGIHNPIGNILTNLRIERNIVANLNTGEHAIELVSACTGMLTDNRMYGDTLGTILDPGSLFCNGNLETDAIDQAGVDSPRTSAGGFADDSITAATIAAGAIDAATFAAGAIDAAAIAAGAIDAATFAAGAIDAAAIANDALDSTAFALSAGEKTTDGIVVTRATAALPQTAAVALFTVTGHVQLKRILGVVTADIGAVPNVTHLQLNSTGVGATTDLCLAAAGLDVTGDVAATTYEITGTVGDPMVATTNLPKAPSQLLDLLLVPGSLEVECAGSDGGAGRVRWSATYVPLEAGAQMVAA